MVHRYLSLLLISSFIAPCNLHPANKPAFTTSPVTGFIENKGQIIDQNNKPNPGVLYLLHTPGMNIQLRKTGFSYDVYSIKYKRNPHPLISKNHNLPNSFTSDSLIPEYHFHRIDINLKNANPNPVIETSVPTTDYLNYYTTGTPVEGITHVQSYASVTYRNIYPGIDLQFVADNERLFEYNFILQSGADIASIKLKISGPEKIRKFKDGIHLETTIGEVNETIPICFYKMNDIRIPVKGRFKKIADHLYGFSVDESIPNGAVLLIDPIPTRRWGTYYGGENDEMIQYKSLAVDFQGNIILGGATNSFTNIATAGAFQTTIGSPTDGFFVKFDGNGQRLWGTYFGGTSGDFIYAITVDQAGNIFIVGTTGSTTGIASPGAFQTMKHGGMDSFIVKFDTSGSRLWGTYY